MKPCFQLRLYPFEDSDCAHLSDVHFVATSRFIIPQDYCFINVTPCAFMYGQQRFGGTYCLPLQDRKFSNSSTLKMDVEHAPETSIYSCQRTQRHILENNIGPTLLLILRLWNLKKCGVD